MDPFELVATHLARLRASLNRLAAREAALATTIVLLSAVALTLLLALSLGIGPGRYAWIALGVGLVAAGATVAVFYLRPKRRHDDQERLAHWLEERVDGLHSGVITSVQVRALVSNDHKKGDPEQTDPDLGFSPALAVAAADNTATRLASVDPRSLMDTSRVRRLGWSCLALVTVFGLAAAVQPGLFQEGYRSLTEAPPPELVEPGTRGEGEVVDVLVGDMSLRLIYPAYLGLQPRTVERSSGDLEAVAGTEVQLTGVALEDADRVVLLFESDPESRWPVELKADGVVSAAFRVGESDRYQFMITRPGGGVVRERTWRNVDARRDLEPEVRLLLPESDLEVHAGDEVPLLFEATDDYGIDRVELVIAHADGREPVKQILKRGQGSRTLRGSDTLVVGELGLEPGDHVDVHFEAVDLNTVQGPGVGRSVKRRIQMYSPEEEHEELLAGLEELMSEMIDNLADRLESPVDERQPSRLARYIATQQNASLGTGELLTKLEALVSAGSTDPLASERLREGLRGIFVRLQDVHEQEQNRLERALKADVVTARPSVLVGLLHGVNEEAIGELENAILSLKDLVEQSRKDKLLESGRDLLDTQDELMDLLKKLKEHGGEEVAAEAQKKLDQLQDKLKKMQNDLSKLSEQVPYENQNMNQEPGELQTDMQDIQSQIEKAKQLLAEGKIDEAMKLLEELNKATQQMMASLQEEVGPPSGASQQVQKQMQGFQEKLGQVANGQQGVHDETGEVQQRIEANRREQLQEALEKAREKAARIENELNSAEGDPLHPQDQEGLDQLRESAKQLGESLQKGDVEQALEQAKRLGEGSKSLKDEVGQSEAREMDAERAEGMRGAMERLGKGQQMSEELAGDLEGMMPKPGQGQGKREQQELQGLGERQGQLSQELSKLGQELEKLDQQIPGIKDALQPMLDGAGEAMKKAGEQLGEQGQGNKPGDKPGQRPGGQQPGEGPPDPQAAQKHQREALDKLGQALEELDQKMSQSQKQGGGSETVGPNDPRRKVAIPEAEDYKVPKEFREEILRAMKERAPERYKEQIERYYEELVK